jgi:hypothetical protein
MAHTNQTPPGRAGLGDAFCRRGSTSEWITQTPRPLQAPRYEPRFRRQVEAIHRLGPVVLGYLVEELAAGAELRATVATYAELGGDFIAAFGCDKFPLPLRSIDGGRI